jgi:hypothetical protein
VHALWFSFVPLFNLAAILLLFQTQAIEMATKASNKILHNNIQLCSKKPLAQYSLKAMIMSNHIHHRGAT